MTPEERARKIIYERNGSVAAIAAAIRAAVEEERGAIAKIVQRGTVESIFSADGGTIMAETIRARGDPT